MQTKYKHINFKLNLDLYYYIVYNFHKLCKRLEGEKNESNRDKKQIYKLF